MDVAEQTLGALSAAHAIHGVLLMQPSTVPSLGPRLSSSVAVSFDSAVLTVLAPSACAKACIVGDGTTAILARLSRLIQAQGYVDFAELVVHNLELLRRMQATAEPASGRQVRQIRTLPTRVNCFATYAGILLEALCPGKGSEGVPAAGSARSSVPHRDRLAIL